MNLIKILDMKKLTLIVLALIVTNINSFSQISAGGGLSFGTEAKTIGFNLRGQYSITESIDLVGGLTFFLPKTETQTIPFVGTIKTKSTLFSFDVDGHYNFSINDKICIFPLSGLNITNASVSVNNTKTGDTKVGLNVGAGGAYKISESLNAFVETKYIIGKYDQLVIALGILYQF